MIKSRLLSNFKNISHGFFNSEGGYSNGIYKRVLDQKIKKEEFY